MKLSTSFIDDIRGVISAARTTVARGVDLVQVHTAFKIGRRIVEQEQHGKGRAAYGTEVVKALAGHLADEFGRGFSARNLAYMRTFYLLCQERAAILQSLTGRSEPAKKLQSATGESSSAPPRPFTLSWTHYVFLLGIKNPDERSFYEIETARQDCPAERLWYARQAMGQDRSRSCHRTTTVCC